MLHHVGHWPRAHSSRLISVKMPAIILILLSYLSNIFMVLDLNAVVFFHMFNPPFFNKEQLLHLHVKDRLVYGFIFPRTLVIKSYLERATF